MTLRTLYAKNMNYTPNTIVMIKFILSERLYTFSLRDIVNVNNYEVYSFSDSVIFLMERDVSDSDKIYFHKYKEV